MIIVSQDGKSIVENLNLGINEPGEYNQNYVIYNTELGEELGEYATEERAKEVLEEITQYYKKFEYFREVTIGQRHDDTRKNESGVYEMPKS